MKNTKSAEILERSRKFIPGGVNSPVRSFRGVGGNAFVAARGDGPFIYDVDENKYIDLVCSWGALVHGHNHPRIREAISTALPRGTSFGITAEAEVELCELISKLVPGVEMLRLVNSGTEACMSALRLARGATGRDLIIKFSGNYHGHGDSFLVAAGSGGATLQIPDSAGIPKKTLEDTIVLPFNDEAKLKEVFSIHGHKIAGVILEVVAGNMGVVPANLPFISLLRRLTRESGSVLIFDEVMTGFRLALEGTQKLYSIQPDLFCFGKIIGGGLPVGAYGGKKSLMEKIAPLGPVYQAGTLSGNPLCASAGLASLKIILDNEKLFYQALDANASEWKSQMDSHIQMKSYPVSIAQVGSMVTVFFRATPPQSYEEAQQADINRFKLFFWSLMNQGVYYPPSAFEACFLSAAHNSVMDQITSASLLALDAAFSK